MKFIRDILAECRAANRPSVSFEFFPPKTAEGERTFFQTALPKLASLKPDFCSVTYGAGGSTRDKTLEIVERIQKEQMLPTMMHLTCVNATEAELRSVIGDAKQRGITNILALRGDMPPGSTEWHAPEGGFEYSVQLVRLLKEMSGLSIGTAGFPEGHIAQKNGKLADWKFLREKIEAGADFVVTQLFFDNADYFEFCDHLEKNGVTVPVLPGVFPILSRAQAHRFVGMCGAKLPAPFVAKLDEIGDNEADAVEYGIEYAVKQCEELLQRGAPGIHFYTLNRAHSSRRILEALSLISP